MEDHTGMEIDRFEFYFQRRQFEIPLDPKKKVFEFFWNFEEKFAKIYEKLRNE